MLMSIQPPGYVSSILRRKLTAILIFLIIYFDFVF